MAGFSCVVVGNESLLVHCAEMALDRGNTIQAVVTRNADVQAWAEGRGLRVCPLDELTGGFDWLLSIANLDIIPDTVLALPTKGAVNFHDGPLPRHAGLNAPVWALLEGEAQHGISWHLIQGGVDEGDILVTRAFDITEVDTALTLNTKAYEAAMASFPALLGQLESGVLQRAEQDLSQRSYHALADRPAGYGLLNFAEPATEVARLVRALDHGTYWNPLCAPKFRAGGLVWLAGSARVTESHAAPGTVLGAEGDTLTIACGGHAVALSGLTRICGMPVDAAQIAKVGDVLPLPTGDEIAQIDAAMRDIAKSDGALRRKLDDLSPAQLSDICDGPVALEQRPLSLPTGAEGAALVGQWVQRLTGRETVDLALGVDAATDLISPWTPLRAGAPMDKARPFATDLPARAPELSWPQTPHIGLSTAGHVPGTVLTVILGDTATLSYDAGKIAPATAELLAARLELLASAPEQILPETERAMVLDQWNATDTDHDRALTMHRAFEAQVTKTPDAIALIFENHRLSYAELNARANRAAHVLREMGVVPGQVVGLCTRRSVDLLVGALAILKAGGAYLPMDPSYPADRLAHFVEDSQAKVIVTQAAVEPSLPPHTADLLVLDAEPRLTTAPDTNLPDTATPQDLAYLIYTSGSTGKPKGVMIEHRNVLNFYTGMDAHIPHDGGTWLAVTSLSFDISVLELFWTTARGLTVVLTGDEDRGLISKGPMPMSDASMQFSIYYWGNDDGVGRDKYKLLLEGAQFADENGFVAVWTPERHFHAFGGPYPNPSVTGAAVAAITRNIGVRSGSVVAPLHHPARIAEEWSVIDNLTNGRAGLAIASGWQPDDFVLRPENTPPNNKPAMIENIDQIRKLWRGEAVGFPRKDGTLHEVVTQPRPVSKELPIWVTTAGNPDTWREAGRLGCNVLTHLLGQSIEEVAGKIKIYHEALREAGHDPQDFTVSLMLHTFVSDSREHAREIARQPMKDYLTSAAGLIKQYAWAFPAFKRPKGVDNAFDLQLDGLEPEELDAILDFAFERYFNDSGLFGTVEDALKRTEELKRIGVDEIACLIDYGIDRETVLEGLRPLAEVVKAANVTPQLAEDDFSIAAQIVRHGVTHLQCTPSMARMIAMNDEARFALRGVQHLFMGGEPLPGALVEDFRQITGATITNMYGPTETTIWSSVERVQGGEGVVNIGLPLANQQLYVLDEAQQPVGIGQEGELWIGGEGVTRGYCNRPELTAERFVPNPFHAGRMYRTGDLVRRRMDGKIDFVGRVDHQVKLRGFRIELGEIEGVLEAQTGVSQAVVLAREDVPGDLRLVGYYTGAELPEAALKVAMARDLPSFMVPGRFVRLEAFPLTPNKKVDRGALPAPVAVVAKPAAPVVTAPVATGDSASVERGIAAIWTQVLGVHDISGRDNFFDLGGHSLLAVQAHRAIREELGATKLSITDIFRFPVLGDLAARVATMVDSGPAPAPTTPPAAPSSDRAQSRSDAMARRREMRARRRA
ncbi:MupA/Atu3671 family FMN-dependent luciferase-like monooxygenase [Tropicibacter naphthalenivorans]|uniref:Dimodular nonribosomal peptide synthase n=1 Tax=Tropicibacter naphthalenivorans TaxID=441103 RepID=A0A0P1GE05_9RHOB|nr:MupA/Atu3671 family FMN-dependent luciferase-like monooxygenase [Tropicibacter naphthalenivorans]CUH79421.1 Dimodular nonribosomal peptide synthase [Tropicibacter naphthalenivorans]SMC72105.1 natural product biosynthesis luciferase-like monooxygenase domain-containing protein [Tropicibacter naphthalenivorans]